MKRTKEHVLETESRRALESFLPPEWIFRVKPLDYGIDIEIEIVEGEEVTNKVLWVQLKGTEDMEKGKVSYQMKTDHLKYYEGCPLPVFILYWIKSENTFYYVFAQKYIDEILSKQNPQWRRQKTVAVAFDSKLETAEDLKFAATEGHFYVIRKNNVDLEYMKDKILFNLYLLLRGEIKVSVVRLHSCMGYPPEKTFQRGLFDLKNENLIFLSKRVEKPDEITVELMIYLTEEGMEKAKKIYTRRGLKLY